MHGLYDWPSDEAEELPERVEHVSTRGGRPPSRGEGQRPPSREGGRRPRSSAGEVPRVVECDWSDEPQEILLEDCFRSRENLDRAMMIEAASRQYLRRDASGTSSRSSAPFRRKEESNHQDSDDYKSMRRPPSRKKNPSHSAVAGLGAFASPVCVTNAFEKAKTVRPQHFETHTRRPPSRHKEPPRSLHLEGAVESVSSQRAAEPRWACARPERAEAEPEYRGGGSRSSGVFTQPQSNGRSDTERNSKSSGSGDGAIPQSLKFEGAAQPVPIPWQAATATAWTRDEKEPHEVVNGADGPSRPMSQLGQPVGGLWSNAPRMQVEDVDDFTDPGLKSLAYKPKVFDARQPQKCRPPFHTSLGSEFLNLFAS